MRKIVAVLLFAALPAFASAPAPAHAPHANAHARPAPGHAAAPQLSEIYRLRLENLNLRAQMAQQQFDQSPQMQQLRSEYAALMQQIQSAYPGYQWDGHALVPRPAAAKPRK